MNTPTPTPTPIRFVSVPAALTDSAHATGITKTAMLVYGMLLGLIRLSPQRGFYDARRKRHYALLPRRAVCIRLGISHQTAVRAFAELAGLRLIEIRGRRLYLNSYKADRAGMPITKDELLGFYNLLVPDIIGKAPQRISITEAFLYAYLWRRQDIAARTGQLGRSDAGDVCTPLSVTGAAVALCVCENTLRKAFGSLCSKGFVRLTSYATGRGVCVLDIYGIRGAEWERAASAAPQKKHTAPVKNHTHNIKGKNINIKSSTQKPQVPPEGIVQAEAEQVDDLLPKGGFSADPVVRIAGRLNISPKEIAPAERMTIRKWLRAFSFEEVLSLCDRTDGATNKYRYMCVVMKNEIAEKDFRQRQREQQRQQQQLEADQRQTERWRQHLFATLPQLAAIHTSIIGLNMELALAAVRKKGDKDAIMHKIDSLVRQKAQVLAAAGLPVECLDDDYDPAGVVPDLPQSHEPAPLRPKL